MSDTSTLTSVGTLVGAVLGSGGLSGVAVLWLTKRQLRKYKALPERRADHTDVVIKRAAEAAALAASASVAKAFELHLGTNNGEIKKDMATIKEYIRNHPIICGEIHKRTDAQISDVKSIALAADEKAQQALLQGHR